MTTAQQHAISRLGLIDARPVDRFEDSITAADGSIIAWEPDAADHDCGTVIEPDGRILTDASGEREPFYLAS